VAERTYVIGDIGGHRKAFEDSLALAGLDKETLKLPPDVYVVQLGDLIDRGPYSYECVALAHDVSDANPKHYIQLVGNHEANWLSLDNHFGTDSDSASVNRVLSWAREGGLYLAAYVAAPEPWLLTHAGLTRGLWDDLRSPESVAAAARAINDAWNNPLFYDFVARPGMLLGDQQSQHAGVFWADAARELIASWATHDLPFNQAHGHSVPWDYYRHNWKLPAPRSLDRYVDEDKRHVTTKIGNMAIVSIDPCLGKRGTASFKPLVLAGAAHVLGAPVSIH
jgi:hypothetical protein